MANVVKDTRHDGATGCWFGLASYADKGQEAQGAIEAVRATIDQPDIRGSEPHFVVFYFLGEVGSSFQKVACKPRSELIGPGSFDHGASQLSIACLGNKGLNSAPAAGVLAGNLATVAHQLPGSGEARQVADFCDNSNGADLRHSAQSLQHLNDRPRARRCRACRLADGGLQSSQALSQVFDFMNSSVAVTSSANRSKWTFNLIHPRWGFDQAVFMASGRRMP